MRPKTKWRNFTIILVMLMTACSGERTIEQTGSREFEGQKEEANNEISAISAVSRFEVKAEVPKNRTGINITSGDVMHFEYQDGQWTGDNSKPGLTTGCGFTYHDPDPNHVWSLPPEQRGAALIGYVGSQPFWIGCDPISIVADISGELYLGMSDCRDCFWDNEGELYVSISVQRK